jgi:hypothetical protein
MLEVTCSQNLGYGLALVSSSLAVVEVEVVVVEVVVAVVFRPYACFSHVAQSKMGRGCASVLNTQYSKGIRSSSINSR